MGINLIWGCLNNYILFVLKKKSPGSCCNILVLVTRKEVCDLCNCDPSQEHITYAWHEGTTVIFRQCKMKLSETCSLQVYYTAYSDTCAPTFRGGITTVNCIISQQSADPMYITAEALNHKRFCDSCFSGRPSLLFLVIFSTKYWKLLWCQCVRACFAHGVDMF